MRITLFAFTVLFCSGALAQGRIEVVVTNIKVPKGDIRVGLFSNEKDFLEKAVAGKVVRVEGDKAIVLFDNVDTGEYALSVIHDENGNEELDTNIMGIPKEGFAFGNNAMGTFGPPSFDKAKIKVDNNTVRQEIALKHF